MIAVFRRMIGFLLIIASISGLAFSIVGLVGVWRIQPQVTKNLQTSVDLLDTSLETTTEALTVTQQALKSSVDTVSALQSTVQTTAKTIQTSQPMVDSITKMMGTDLPETIQATQKSLTTAQESAKVIDSVLSMLSGIPFVGSSLGYNPQVPLNVALGEVAASLNDLPNSLADMNDSLKQTSSNLETFQADLETMATSIGETGSSMAQYESVVTGYQASLAKTRTQLETLKADLPKIVKMAVWGLTFFLAWMAIAQIGLFTQGLELMSGRKASHAAVQEADPKNQPAEAAEEK